MAGPHGRRTLAAGVAALLANAVAIAASEASSDPDYKATPQDYADAQFDPVPGLVEGLGTRTEWLAQMGNRYPTLYLGAATLARTQDQLTAMAATEPDAVVNLMQCLQDLTEKLEAERAIMQAAFIRLMSGCCRAGLA